MNRDDAIQAMPRTDTTSSGHAPAVWWAAGIAFVVLLLVHLPTAMGVIDTWGSSVSYNHGYLVLPVSAWLLWRGRDRYRSVNWTPWWPALIGIALLGTLWFFGYLTNIKSFRDLALIASLPALMVAMLGIDFGRRAVFPLAFALFAWPFGEVFIPHLVDLTANFTVLALRTSGVPVFRDGNNFVIPSGEWSVVQECSGVNYLLVSLFAGSLFGYLNFRSNRRRLVFLAFALIVPIAANWLRAYGIVLLGHLTDNKLATGVDHLIYGWLFFGIVMTALFYFALRFMGETEAVAASTAAPTAGAGSPPMRRIWTAAAVAIAVSAIPPIAAAALDAMGRSAASQAVPELPRAFGPWSIAQEPAFGWPTPFERATSSQREIYRRSDEQVELHFAWYASDSGAAKMTRFEGATLAEFDPTWRLQSRHDLRVDALTPPLTVVEREVRSPRIRILVWQWGLIGGIEASGFVGSKLALARAKLSGKGSNSAGVALVTPIEDGNVAAARAKLQALTTELRPWLQNPGATKP